MPPKDLRVVVVGAGRVGRHVARDLDDSGHSVVVVERDDDRCEDLATDHFATIVNGDGADPTILDQVDLERADVLAALTPDSGTNLGISLLAERRTDDLRTVIRVSEAKRAAAYREFVDEVVFPERAGAHAAVNAVVGGDVRAVETLSGELTIAEFRVAEDAPAAGRTLAEVSLPHGSLVVSDADANNVSQPETVLEAGRSYLVAVEPEVADEVRQLLQG